MASTISIISSSTTYHLSPSGDRTFYDGTGSPWTSAATTPFTLAMNDVTGPRWTPQAPQRIELYSGSPPIRNGRTPLYASYDNVTETIPIQCYATTHDNAVKLLQVLYQALNTALYTAPAVLAVKPNGATNTVYYEIYGADIQEDPRFINDEAALFAAPQSKGTVRALVTLRRSYVGGAASLATLINAATFNNKGTGATNNTQALGTLTGDLIYEGQPLNIKAVASSSQAFNWCFASVLSRTYTAFTSATTTSSTTGANIGAVQTASVDTIPANAGVRVRVLGQATLTTAPTKIQLQAQVRSSNGENVYVSPWVPMVSSAGAGDAAWIDFGGFDPSFLRVPITTASNLSIRFQVRSSDGTSVTVTFISWELLLYYDFCFVETPNEAANGTKGLRVSSAQNLNGSAWLPLAPAHAYIETTATTALSSTALIYGMAPRAFSGASLYIAFFRADIGKPYTGVYDNTANATITATHAPLYRTLRGSN